MKKLRPWHELPPVKIPKACYDSQQRALSELIIEACGGQIGGRADAALGDTRMDAERMFLSNVEATGSAMNVRGLLRFIRMLWEPNRTELVETSASPWRPTLKDMNAGLERRVIPNPYRSEARLNRFLIKLGRALATTKKRAVLPDWLHNVDQTERFIVEGWCERIVVDGEWWPPLCCFTYPALQKFLKGCKRPLATNDSDINFRQKIQRLGLVGIPKGKIKCVEKRGGRLLFA